MSKSINISSTFNFFFVLSFCLMFASCKYSDYVPDPNYPEQTIYLPAAVNRGVQGLFKIDKLTPVLNEHIPVPGAPYRYLIDSVKNHFIVPLAVYRAGIDNKGDFKIEIFESNSLVENFITSGDLPSDTKILPDNQYVLDEHAIMGNGSELAPFKLIINFNFIKNNPDEIYAIGVGIKCDDRKVNPELGTVVISIDTKVFK